MTGLPAGEQRRSMSSLLCLDPCHLRGRQNVSPTRHGDVRGEHELAQETDVCLPCMKSTGAPTLPFAGGRDVAGSLNIAAGYCLLWSFPPKEISETTHQTSLQTASLHFMTRRTFVFSSRRRPALTAWPRCLGTTLEIHYPKGSSRHRNCFLLYRLIRRQRETWGDDQTNSPRLDVPA